MTDDQAAQLVKRLLGCYPSLSLHDPQTYITELISLLRRFPDWVGEKAIEAAKAESPAFVPSVPIVNKACNEAFETTRQTVTYADEWHSGAQLQLQKRVEFDSKPPASKEFMARMRDEMAKHGMFILGAKADQPADNSLRDQFGLTDAEVDAIPNQPVNQSYWDGNRSVGESGGLRQLKPDDLRAIYAKADGVAA